MKLSIHPRRWSLKAPFVTAGEVVTHIDVLTVTLSEAGLSGHAETMGVDYLGETVGSMTAQLSAFTEGDVSQLIDPSCVVDLPAGGSRNGVDCALWDLRAKQAGGIEQLTGRKLMPVETLFTVTLDRPENMAEQALAVPHLKQLKLKLGDEDTLASLQAVRNARPDARLVIDANGSWNRGLLEALGDALARLDVALLEQPLPVAEDHVLERLNYPVPLCADESCQGFADLERIADRYDAINIKLDKCGGLTEALKMADWCRRHRKQVMVGNMLGSSLAMAPALVVAQHADFVDLDGPLWQREDVAEPLSIEAGRIFPPPPGLWG